MRNLTMNRIGGLREDSQLGAALKTQMEQWLLNTNPQLVKQLTETMSIKHHQKSTSTIGTR